MQKSVFKKGMFGHKLKNHIHGKGFLSTLTHHNTTQATSSKVNSDLKIVRCDVARNLCTYNKRSQVSHL